MTIIFLILCTISSALKFKDAEIIPRIGKSKEAYLGIPFAKPPIRFELPERASLPIGNLTLDKFTPECIQFGFGFGFNSRNEQTEDCLKLNVFVPLGTQSNEKLPVIIYIHGGGFAGGSAMRASNDMENIPNGIIGVTFNYRLGLLGFLPGNGVKRNIGLFDQKMAIEWVHQNIEFFGGDPNQITCAGESAGALSLTAHLTSNNGKGLNGICKRMIMLSGGASILPPKAGEEQQEFEELLKQTNCQDMTCLKNVDLESLKTAARSMDFTPGIDGTYITIDDITALNTGKFEKVPLLVHTNANEGSVFGLNALSEESARNLRRQQFPDFSAEFHNKIDSIYEFTGPGSSGDFFGDVVFECPTYLLSNKVTESNVEIYNAYNTHQNQMDSFDLPFGINLGVYHGSELPHFFGITDRISPNETEFSTKLQKAYFDFAKGLKPLESWPPYGSSQTRFYIDINKGVKDELRLAKCNLILEELKTIAEGRLGANNSESLAKSNLVTLLMVIFLLF